MGCTERKTVYVHAADYRAVGASAYQAQYIADHGLCVVNASRPIYGSEPHLLWSYSTSDYFQRGPFYAAGDPNAQCGSYGKLEQYWLTHEAWPVVLVSNEVIMELMVEDLRADGYTVRDYENAGFGHADLARHLGYPWRQA
jgi:hypothetical protein